MSPEPAVNIRVAPGAGILDVEGDLTSRSEDRMKSALHDERVIGCQNVVINLSGCSYINSAGISILIAMLSEIRKSTRTMSVFGLSPHYQKMFQMVGLTRYVKICANEKDALTTSG